MIKQSFSGFSDKAEAIPVPGSFFTDLMPAIEDINELKITLYLIWLIKHKKGLIRFVTLPELLNNSLLLNSMLAVDSGDSKDIALANAVQMAAKRGTLVEAKIQIGGKQQQIFLLNAVNERKHLDQALRGEITLAGIDSIELRTGPSQSLRDIYSLYEQNIGLISPMIAEELRKAEDAYPRDWLVQAFQEAAELNKRNWRYIVRILERWATEGKDDGKTGGYSKKEKDTGKYTRGKFGHMVKQ
jgi:DNA replication protein